MQTVTIEEVIGRSEQGKTRPFLCRGEDGFTYFVKGQAAGQDSLIKELLCGQLAQAFGLQIAPFALVDVPEALLRPTIRADIAELGAGVCFGSRALPHVQEFSLANKDAAELDADFCRQAADIFVFDWWVCNQDRTLTVHGGNPNLLWDYQQNQLVVIDHNLAFDEADATLACYETHVFYREGTEALADYFAKDTFGKRLEDALAGFELACDNVPSAWWWYADGVPTAFDRVQALRLLSRFQSDSFWEGPK